MSSRRVCALVCLLVAAFLLTDSAVANHRAKGRDDAPTVAVDDILKNSVTSLRKRAKVPPYVFLFLDGERFDILNSEERERLRKFAVQEYESTAKDDPAHAKNMALLVAALDWQPMGVDAARKLGLPKPEGYEPAAVEKALGAERKAASTAGVDKPRIEKLIKALVDDYGTVPSVLREKLYRLSPTELKRLEELRDSDTTALEKALRDPKLADDSEVTERAHRTGVSFDVSPVPAKGDKRDEAIARNRRAACDALVNVTKLTDPKKRWEHGAVSPDVVKLFEEYYRKRRGISLSREITARETTGKSLFGASYSGYYWEYWASLQRYLMEECYGLNPEFDLSAGDEDRHKKFPKPVTNLLDPALVDHLSRESQERLKYWVSLPNVRALMPLDYMKLRLAEIDRDVRHYTLTVAGEPLLVQAKVNDMIEHMLEEKDFLLRKLYGPRVGLGIFWDTGILREGDVHPFHNDFDWSKATPASLKQASADLPKLSYYEATELARHVRARFGGKPPEALAGFLKEVDAHVTAKAAKIKPVVDKLNAIAGKRKGGTYTESQHQLKDMPEEQLLDILAYVPGDTTLHAEVKELVGLPLNLYERKKRGEYNSYGSKYKPPEIEIEERLEEIGHFMLDSFRHPDRKDADRAYSLRPLSDSKLDPNTLCPRDKDHAIDLSVGGALLFYFKGILADNGENKLPLLGYPLCFKKGTTISQLLSTRAELLRDLEVVLSSRDGSSKYNWLSEISLPPSPVYKRLLSLALANAIRSIDKELLKDKAKLYRGNLSVSPSEYLEHLKRLLPLVGPLRDEDDYVLRTGQAIPKDVRPLVDYLQKKHGIGLPSVSLGALIASPPSVRKAISRLVARAQKELPDDETLHTVVAQTILDPGSWTAAKQGLSPQAQKLMQGILVEELASTLAPLKPPFKVESLETLTPDQREQLREWVKEQLKAQVTVSSKESTTFRQPQVAAALALLKNALDERGHPEETLEHISGGVARHEAHDVYRAIVEEDEALKTAGCVPPKEPLPLHCERLQYYRKFLDTHGRGTPSPTRVRLLSPNMMPVHYDSLRRLEAIMGKLKDPSGQKEALDTLLKTVTGVDPGAVELASSVWDREYYSYVHTPYGKKQATEKVVRALMENECKMTPEARAALDKMARLLAEADVRKRVGQRNVSREDIEQMISIALNGTPGGIPGTRFALERQLRIEAAKRLVLARFEEYRKKRDPKLKGAPLTKKEVIDLKLLDDKTLRACLDPIGREEMEQEARQEIARKHAPGTKEFNDALAQALFVDGDAARKKLKPEKEEDVRDRLHALLAHPDGNIERVPREAFIQDYLRDNLMACIERFEAQGIKIPASFVVLDTPAQKERVEIWAREMAARKAVGSANFREFRQAEQLAGRVRAEIGVLKPRVEQQAKQIQTIAAQRIPRSKEIESLERYYEQNKAALEALERELEKAIARVEMLGEHSDPEVLRAEAAAEKLIQKWIDDRFKPEKEFPASEKLYQAALQPEVLAALVPTAKRRFKIQFDDNKFFKKGEDDLAEKKEEFAKELARIRAVMLLRKVEVERRSNALRVKVDRFDRATTKEEGDLFGQAQEQYEKLAAECLKYLQKGDEDKKRAAVPFPLASETGEVHENDLKIVVDALRQFQTKKEQAEALARALQPPPGVDGAALRPNISHPSHNSLYRELKQELISGENLPFRMSGERFDAMFADLNKEAEKARDEKDARLTAILAKLTPYGFKWNGASLDWKKAKLWKIGTGAIQSLAELKQLLTDLGEFGIYAGTGKNPWIEIIEEVRKHYVTDFVRQFRMGSENVVRVDPGIGKEVMRVGKPMSADFLLDPENAEKHLAFLDPAAVEPPVQKLADRLHDNLERYSRLSKEVAVLSRSLFAAEILSTEFDKWEGEFTRKSRELDEVLAAIRKDLPDFKEAGRVEVKWKGSDADDRKQYAVYLAEVLEHQMNHVTNQEYHMLTEQAQEDLEASRQFYREWIATEVATYLVTAGLGNLATLPTKAGRAAKLVTEIAGGVKLGYRFSLANKVLTEAYENSLWTKPLHEQVAMRPTSLLESAHRQAWTFGALGPVKHIFRALGLPPIIADPLAMGAVSYTVNRSFGDPSDKALRQALVMMPLAFPWEELAAPVIANTPWLVNRPWLARAIAVPTVTLLNTTTGVGVALFEHYGTEEGYAGLDGQKMTNAWDVAAHAFFTNIGQDAWGGFNSTRNLHAEVLRYRFVHEPKFTVDVAHKDYGTLDPSTGKVSAPEDVHAGLGAVHVHEFEGLLARKEKAMSPTEKKRLGDIADEVARAQGFKDAADFKAWLDAYSKASLLPRPKYQPMEEIGPLVREFARSSLAKQYKAEKGTATPTFKNIDDLIDHPMFSSAGHLHMDAARHLPIEDLTPKTNNDHADLLRQIGDHYGMGGDRMLRFFKETGRKPGETVEQLAKSYKSGKKEFEKKLEAEAAKERPDFLAPLFTGTKGPPGYHAEGKKRVDDVKNKEWVFDDIKLSQLDISGKPQTEHHKALVDALATRYGINPTTLRDMIRDRQKAHRSKAKGAADYTLGEVIAAARI